MNRAASEALFNEHVKNIDGPILESRNWRVFERAFPVLDVGFEAPSRRAIRIRMQCEDWNELPPAIAVLSLEGEVLMAVPTGPTSVFNAGPHETTHKPFICMAGSREYHTLSSHVGDVWENYKTVSGYSLGGILEQIWSAWLKSTP